LNLTKTKQTIFLVTFLTLVFKGFCCGAQNTETNYTYGNNESGERDPVLDTQLTNLRIFHEGAIFVLKRYATMEALISAVEDGHSENEGFWIGASSVIPGTGQMINQDYLQGGLLLFTTALSWGTVNQLAFTRVKRSGSDSILPLYYSSLVLRNGIMTYAMLHAANKSYRVQHDRTVAMWTGTASLLPGTGQAINGDWWEAAGLFISWGLAAALVSHFETAVYETGDEGYLVKSPEENDWAVSWVPGGATLSYTMGW
jgi:hypothetical protein